MASLLVRAPEKQSEVEDLLQILDADDKQVRQVSPMSGLVLGTNGQDWHGDAALNTMSERLGKMQTMNLDVNSNRRDDGNEGEKGEMDVDGDQVAGWRRLGPESGWKSCALGQLRRSRA